MNAPDLEPQPDTIIETVFVADDPNQQVVAESLLTEAGIPFESRNDALQNVIGWGRLGGSNPLVGPVEILVPAAYAAEARALLEPGTTELDAAAMAAVADLPPELELPAEPANPKVVRVRRLALGSIVCTLILPSYIGPAAGVVLGLWALGLSHDDDEVLNRWRVFAACGALAGLVGIWLAVTAPTY